MELTEQQCEDFRTWCEVEAGKYEATADRAERIQSSFAREVGQGLRYTSSALRIVRLMLAPNLAEHADENAGG